MCVCACVYVCGGFYCRNSKATAFVTSDTFVL